MFPEEQPNFTHKEAKERLQKSFQPHSKKGSPHQVNLLEPYTKKLPKKEESLLEPYVEILCQFVNKTNKKVQKHKVMLRPDEKVQEERDLEEKMLRQKLRKKRQQKKRKSILVLTNYKEKYQQKMLQEESIQEKERFRKKIKGIQSKIMEISEENLTLEIKKQKGSLPLNVQIAMFTARKIAENSNK